MLRIYTQHGDLAVPADIEIPLTVTNPLFADRGSYSLPFTVPLTANIVALGLPAGLDSAYAVGRRIRCTIEQPPVVESGMLEIISIAEDEIELSLTTREGEFWEWARETNMRKLTGKVGIDLNWSMLEIENHLKAEMAFFPVATDSNEYNQVPFVTIHDDGNGNMYATTANNEDMMRMIDDMSKLEPQWQYPYKYPYETNWSGSFKYNIVNNIGVRLDTRLRNDKSGYLRLNKVLDIIATNFGANMGNNELNIEEMQGCVVLNNLSSFDYRSIIYGPMLPNCTIIEFIEAVENTFGCVFIFDTRLRAINIKLIKNILTSRVVELDRATIIQQPPVQHEQQLAVKCERVSSPNTTSAPDIPRLTPFYGEEYPSTNTIYTHEQNVRENKDTVDLVNYPNRIVFSVPMQCWVKLKWVQGSNDSTKWDYRATIVKSNYEDRINSTEYSTIDRSSKNHLLPMIQVDSVVLYIDNSVPVNNNNLEYRCFIHRMFIPHFNVHIQRYPSDIVDNEAHTRVEECPIAFTFERGNYTANLHYINYRYSQTPRNIIAYIGKPYYYGNNQTVSFNWGSSDIYAEDGEHISTSNHTHVNRQVLPMRYWGDSNLYDKFFRELEHHYLTSHVAVEIQGLTGDEALQLELHRIYRINGVNVIITEIETSITASGIEVVSIKCVTTKPYLHN